MTNIAHFTMGILQRQRHPSIPTTRPKNQQLLGTALLTNINQPPKLEQTIAASALKCYQKQCGAGVHFVASIFQIFQKHTASMNNGIDKISD